MWSSINVSASVSPLPLPSPSPTSGSSVCDVLLGDLREVLFLDKYYQFAFLPAAIKERTLTSLLIPNIYRRTLHSNNLILKILTATFNVREDISALVLPDFAVPREVPRLAKAEDREQASAAEIS